MLAATCYLTDNALTHEGTGRNYACNHSVFLHFYVKVWPLFKSKHKGLFVKILVNYMLAMGIN